MTSVLRPTEKLLDGQGREPRKYIPQQSPLQILGDLIELLTTRDKGHDDAR